MNRANNAASFFWRHLNRNNDGEFSSYANVYSNYTGVFSNYCDLFGKRSLILASLQTKSAYVKQTELDMRFTLMDQVGMLGK